MNAIVKKIILASGLIAAISTTSFAYTNIVSDTLNTQVNAAVDTVGPIISASIQFKHINLKKYESTMHTTKVASFPKSSELSINGTDKAGVKEIFISIDNATELQYKDPIRLTARGKHTAQIRAVDNVGNETIYSFTYVITE